MGMGKWGRLLRVDILFGEQKDRPNPLTLIPYSVLGARALGFFSSSSPLHSSPSSLTASATLRSGGPRSSDLTSSTHRRLRHSEATVSAGSASPSH
nr:hypothetical protein Iba_chr09bCG13470 [Ipomoea batatas]